MKIYVNEREYNLSLQFWDEERGCWNPDCFGDLELSVTDEQTISGEQFAEIVDYWDEQTDLYNAHKPCELNGYANWELIDDYVKKHQSEVSFWVKCIR